jgi:hypothetical protein
LQPISFKSDRLLDIKSRQSALPPSKPLVPAQVAPLSHRQLSQRDAAEADAFHRQHLQADGFAQVRDLSR